MSPPSQIDTNTATITGSEPAPISRNVLRITSGETIRIIDGRGNVYTAEILDTPTNRSSSEARIHTHEFHATPSPTLTLFQGLPKNDKMELILPKDYRTRRYPYCPTALGTRLTKTESESIRSLAPRRHLCQQSSVNVPGYPSYATHNSLRPLSPQLESFSLSLLLSPHAEVQHIKTVLRKTSTPNAIALFIGPEGGFSNREIAAAIERGCIPVTLGRNILRTENRSHRCCCRHCL